MKNDLASQTAMTQIGCVKLDERGYIRVAAVRTDPLTLANVQEVIASITTLSQGRKVPVLVDVQRGAPLTKEAREYLVGREATAVTLALAIVVHSPVGKAAGNFFLRIQKSMIPTQVFTSEENAILWLKEFAK